MGIRISELLFLRSDDLSNPRCVHVRGTRHIAPTLDRRQHLSRRISADQRIARFRDQLYPFLAVPDVAALSKGNLHKGLNGTVKAQAETRPVGSVLCSFVHSRALL